MITTYKTLQEIPPRDYIGYLWEANQENPIVLPKKDYPIGTWGKKSFLIEAWLFSQAENCAIFVRHTGQYHITEYNLNQVPEEGELVSKDMAYLSHRLYKSYGITKLRFQQLWLPETDPNCENMEVLQLKALIFNGFTYSKTEENA